MKKNKTNQRRVYKIKNWTGYNKSLVQRGHINLWFKGNLRFTWYDKSRANGAGRKAIYSDSCIQLCLVIKALYRLPYRQVQGFLESFFEINGIDLDVPCYTQMSRRAASLRIPLKRFPRKGPIDVAIDSTGLKVYGQGEWRVRQHGSSKRRTWKKLHLAVDPLDNEIVATRATPSNWSDDVVFSELIDSIEEPVERIFADGAYDTLDCYRESYDRGCQLITPPQRNAVVRCQEKTPWLEQRNQAVVKIHAYEQDIGLDEARSRWKHESDYHERSLAETAMYRLKRLLGNQLWSLKENSQEVEIRIKVNLLNQFTGLGMPDSLPEVP